MTSAPHFIHRIDPVLADLGSIRLWYYGLAYAIGFLGIHLWLRGRRERLGWRVDEVYDFSLFSPVCILVIGHAFEIFVYEWSYYRQHPWQMLNYWNGGMSTHGVLLGATLGAWMFCRLRGKRFLDVADELVIPAAFFMGIGRLGNFINGENYGPITDVRWAVKFPYAEGFRHPVDLYDALKNFTIVLMLLVVRRARPPGGCWWGISSSGTASCGWSLTSSASTVRTSWGSDEASISTSRWRRRVWHWCSGAHSAFQGRAPQKEATRFGPRRERRQRSFPGVIWAAILLPCGGGERPSP